MAQGLYLAQGLLFLPVSPTIPTRRPSAVIDRKASRALSYVVPNLSSDIRPAVFPTMSTRGGVKATSENSELTEQ